MNKNTNHLFLKFGMRIDHERFLVFRRNVEFYCKNHGKLFGRVNNKMTKDNLISSIGSHKERGFKENRTK